MMIDVYFDLGIISGEQKRLLESFIGSKYFEQRKNYDEYYFSANMIAVEEDIGVHDLMVIADLFHVEVFPNSLHISDAR